MRRKVLLILAAMILLGVAAWAIWGLGSSLQDQAEQETIFERLRKISTEDVPTDLGTSSKASEDHSRTENDVSSVAEPEVYSLKNTGHVRCRTFESKDRFTGMLSHS